MGRVKLFPSPEYTSKQPKDPVVPKLPMTGILLGPSKSGKTVALISMILEQYRGCFERIYIFSPSINVDDGWRPVKKYIEETMKVPVDREQTYFEEWDEPALRQIIRQQRKITETSKQLKMRSLFQILIVIDDFADNPHLHKRSGDSALDTLFVRGRHFQISTLVSTQKLRLVSNAVRVNSQFFCIWRLRNQLEKDSLLEELTALVPKPQLEASGRRALQLPLHLPAAEPAGKDVPHPLRARLPARKRDRRELCRWGSCWGRSSASCWAAARCSRASARTLAAAPPPPPTRASTTLPSLPGCSSSGSSRSPGRSRSPRTRRTPPPACPAQQAGGSVEGKKR